MDEERPPASAIVIYRTEDGQNRIQVRFDAQGPWVTQAQLADMLLGIDEGWTAQILSFQCVLWIVAVYFTVARFLSYLDQRIRSEGWEVELCLRAQRDRLTRQAA
jgi:hypothetical protein